MRILKFLGPVLFAFLFPAVSFAAGLYVTPIEGTYRVNEIFTATIRLDSIKQYINAAEGALHFPPKMLEVVRVSKTGSILTLWPEEPSFSNEAGIVRFAGAVEGGFGFKGAGAPVLQIVFRSLYPGSAALDIKDAQVFSSDGRGTPVLENTEGATITISNAAFPEPQPPVAPAPISLLMVALITILVLILAAAVWFAFYISRSRGNGKVGQAGFDVIKHDVANVFWNLEKKLKKNGKFSQEERESREKLMKELDDINK
jgi:hypothetical protein